LIGLARRGGFDLAYPLTLALSAVARFRSDRDGLFWLGATFDVLLAVGTITLLSAHR
jgi:hypothetical protein